MGDRDLLKISLPCNQDLDSSLMTLLSTPEFLVFPFLTTLPLSGRKGKLLSSKELLCKPAYSHGNQSPV